MVAGYEHFNQERLLAIQAAPNAQARAGPATLPYHPLMDDSPKPSAMKVTAANTVPLAPRKTLLSKDHKTHDREVDELVRNLRNAAASQDRALKHKRSDSDLRDESSKKRKIEPAFMPQVLSPRDLSGSPMSFSCVRCICERSDCDGASQCAYCRAAGSKCVYLLCGKHGDCQTLDCRLIHDWQYDESSRKHGQVRRNVLGGTVHSERLARSVIEQLSNAQVLMVGLYTIEGQTSIFDSHSCSRVILAVTRPAVLMALPLLILRRHTRRMELRAVLQSSSPRTSMAEALGCTSWLTQGHGALKVP